MPNITGQIKRDKQNAKIKVSNKIARSRMRTMVKEALSENAGADKVNSAISLVNKSVSKGIIKSNTASRINSQLSKKIN